MAIIKVFAVILQIFQWMLLYWYINKTSTIKLHCGTHQCTLTFHFVQWLSLQNNYVNALCGLLRGKNLWLIFLKYCQVLGRSSVHNIFLDFQTCFGDILEIFQCSKCAVYCVMPQYGKSRMPLKAFAAVTNEVNALLNLSP